MLPNTSARQILMSLILFSSSSLFFVYYFILHSRDFPRVEDWLDHRDLEVTLLGGPPNWDPRSGGGNVAYEKHDQTRRWEESLSNTSSFNKRQPIIPSNKTKLDEYSPFIFKATYASHLPEALHPVTYNGKCCQVSSSSSEKRANSNCHNVCFTDRACTDELYPFGSLKEKEWFSRRSVPPRNSRERLEAREKCDKVNRKLKPPVVWCRQWMDDPLEGKEFPGKGNKNGNKADQTSKSMFLDQSRSLIDPVSAGLPPPGCSVFSEGGGSGSYQHLILFPQAKLALCGIPKVGITQWLQFLRFTLGAKDYQSFPHAKQDSASFRFDKLKDEVQREILNDPEWIFAAFLRDPAERLLSAYLDKAANPARSELRHFNSVYGLDHNLTFEEFVHILSEEDKSCPYDKSSPSIEKLKGVDWCSNPHWRPQIFSCGISEFLPRYSFIGSLNFINTQSRTLLQEVGLWESYGKYYHWNSDKRDVRGKYCNVYPPVLEEGNVLLGFQQLLVRDKNESNSKSDTVYGHTKNSQSKMEAYYHSPELLQKVKSLYHDDFKLWDLIREKKDLSSGSDLAVRISSTCREKTNMTMKGGIM